MAEPRPCNLILGPGRTRATRLREYAMKEEYDFSKVERGKFYRPDAELNVPGLSGF